ncbi:hypothetical protein Tco_0199779 [Tanacetum coccineum]
MAARGGRNNLVARRSLMTDLRSSGERSHLKYHEDDRRNEQDKVADFNRLIAVAEEKIHGKEIDLEMLEAEGNDAFALVCEAPMCLIRIAVGNAVSSFWQVYSEVLLHRLSFGRINWFSDYMDELWTRYQLEGILMMWRRMMKKHSNGMLISGKHRALFSSFLGDMVREHIGLKILSWKKVDSVTPPNWVAAE